MRRGSRSPRASPATVWFSGQGLDADTVTIHVDPGAVTVSDSTATLAVASGCDQVDAHSATCPVADGMRASVYGTLGQGTDAATVTGAIHVELQGGAADDTLSVAGSTGTVDLRGDDGDDRLSISGSPLGGALWGGSGNGVLVAAGGPAWLSGDGGNDRLTGGDQADTLDGGPGRDQLAAEAATIGCTTGRGPTSSPGAQATTPTASTRPRDPSLARRRRQRRGSR